MASTMTRLADDDPRSSCFVLYQPIIRDGLVKIFSPGKLICSALNGREVHGKKEHRKNTNLFFLTFRILLLKYELKKKIFNLFLI